MPRRPDDRAEASDRAGTEAGRNASHILPDILDHGLAVVFCGSAAGSASARAGAYYAGPGNRFWPTLHAIGLTPRPFDAQEFRAVLPLGIGLTDLAKTVSGADSELPGSGDDGPGLRRKIERLQPAWLAFVGKRPARAFLGRPVEYGSQDERIGPTRIYVLPSPSGAARRWWDEGRWFELAALVKGGD